MDFSEQDRLGFGFAALQELNPRLICCSINGVGAEGPYANRRIYDAVVQAISGMATLQSEGHQPTFTFPSRPGMVNTLAADKLTAVTGAFSSLLSQSASLMPSISFGLVRMFSLNTVFLASIFMFDHFDAHFLGEQSQPPRTSVPPCTPESGRGRASTSRSRCSIRASTL